jgi:hypothetical protein
MMSGAACRSPAAWKGLMRDLVIEAPSESAVIVDDHQPFAADGAA